MDSNIIIENENLADYIMFKLDKIDNGFTMEELDQITEVVIDFKEEESSVAVFEELLKLRKLNSIILRNVFIFNDDFKTLLALSELNDVTFENCEFEDADLISSLNLKSLSLVNDKINSYTFVNLFKSLEELTIVNGNIEISKINELQGLKYLQISYSNINDDSSINITSLEELYIDNTNINSFEFLNSLSNLKRLSIDEKQYNSNKELFSNLENKGILVLNENMTSFGGEEDAL